MPSPHLIRLRDPWEFDRSGRWTRHFNLPTNLGSEDRVWLAMIGVLSPALVRLNDVPLGQLDVQNLPQRFDVTELLRPHNRLEVESKAAAEQLEHQLPIDEVRLEIEDS